MLGQGTPGKGVQAANAFILFNPGVPLGFGAIVQPRPDSRHLIGGQLGDGSGNRFDHGHWCSSVR